ncbi:MAG: ASCH domain-containing protein [Candidatus Pacebacteria bacterium]|nr:ASCH domain-containing protein [Candidatus Paceibacterota bacterium]
MKKSWGLLPRILKGEKTMESRWYKNKRLPWDKIKKGEIVYFKNSGEEVTAKAEVFKVLQFSNLNPKKVKQILDKYGEKDGLGKEEINKYYRLFRDKNYCLLVFLKSPRKIKPFEINKRGFGLMSAWITVEHISKIKVS